MRDFDSTAHRETVERYCHVINANTTISRYMDNGKMITECMNRHNCDKNGGCKNSKYTASDRKS